MSSGAVSVIAVVAFLLSALTFIASQIASSRTGRVSALDRCNDEKDRLQAQVEHLKQQAQALQEENVSLMRRLMAAGNGK